MAEAILAAKTRMTLIAAGAIFTLAAQAADYRFPTAGGDISSAEAWGGTIPSGTDTATFDKTGVYTASADVTLPTVILKKDGIAFDLTDTPTRAVTLTGTGVTSADDVFKIQTASGRSEFRGGVWNWGASASARFAVGANATYSGNEMVLNGAVFSGFPNVYVGLNGSRDDTLVLTNGASVCGDSTFVCVARTPSAAGHRLVVNTGSSLDVGSFNTDLAGTRSEATRGNGAVVSGGGSSVTTKANVTVGCRHDANEVLVGDGAALVVGGNLVIGDEAATRDNALAVVGGARAEIAGDCQVGNNGSCNTLTVSNASLVVTGVNGVRIGISSASSSNTVIVAGEAATVTCAKGVLFGSGSFNRLVLTDGFTWDRSGTDANWAEASSNNVVRIENGASYALRNVWLGKSAEGRGNRVEIGADATFTAYRFHTTAIGNGLVISNGTYVGTSLSASGIGDTLDGAEFPDGNYIRLEGNRPAVRFTTESNQGLRVANRSRVEIALPAGGYPENHVPITGGKFSIDGTSDIVLEPDVYLAALGGERGEVTLVSVERSLTIPDEVLARANARLPARCRLVVDGYELVLKTKSNKSLILIYR